MTFREDSEVVSRASVELGGKETNAQSLQVDLSFIVGGMGGSKRRGNRGQEGELTSWIWPTRRDPTREIHVLHGCY